MRIYVGGSLDNVPADSQGCVAFVDQLGRAIVRRGHVLMNGCRSSLDATIARAAHDDLVSLGRDPRESVLSYCLGDVPPAHSYGSVRSSALEDWNMDHEQLRVPEQISQAHAAVFVAGSEGTYWSRNWARFAAKPIVGVPRFGGAGRTIFHQEADRLAAQSERAGARYQVVNSVSADLGQLAEDVVDLVELLVQPREVFTIMSFDRELLDVFEAIRGACEPIGLIAERTDHSTSVDRILPRIESGIRQCVFAIADVSRPSPNVYYEIGYARALGKTVVITAEAGTRLPFDIVDLPTLFWESPDHLSEQLGEFLQARLTVDAGLLMLESQ